MNFENFIRSSKNFFDDTLIFLEHLKCCEDDDYNYIIHNVMKDIYTVKMHMICLNKLYENDMIKIDNRTLPNLRY